MKPSGFRTRLLAGVMLVVAVATGLALWLAQRSAEADAAGRIQGEFRSAFATQLEERRTHLAALRDLCSALARKPRITAALEEDSVQDLYENARTELELRGVIGKASAQAAGAARLFRFLDKNGALIPSPREQVEPWEAQLALGGVPVAQQAGYVVATDGLLLEVVTTPISDAQTGEAMGAMVLVFAQGVKSGGIWLEGRLHLPELAGAALADAEQAATSAVSGPGEVERSAAVQLGGVPHLLFCQLLNAGSKFPGAWQVGIYPLAASLAEQRVLRWKIVGTGALVLLGAYMAAHFLTARLASPVERLAAVSEVHRAGREHAEAALGLTNEELRARNAELAGALERLKAAQHHVVQQERLRALGQMASGVAHDFNNALVPILGFSDLLLMSPETLADAAKARVYLQNIQTAASDAASVVARLREFYRSSSADAEMVPVDLCKMVEQAVALTRPRWRDQAQAAGATIEIKTELEPVPAISGEESALREVLTNLIFNAVDAMPTGGTLTLRTRRVSDGSLVEVEDSGTGMTAEVRRHCLEPFFSTKGERGTGLGLSMVFGIVQRHGGVVDIRSTLGEGTTFCITLPPDHAAPAAVPVAAPVQRGLRVLLVDDEEPVRTTLAAALAHDAHRVTLAEHGVEGLRHFMAESFDLVITDRAMPGMSGEQMAAAMKQVHPRTPVIMLTGFGHFLEKEKFPAVDVLASKPVSISTLREAITTAMQHV